MKQHELAENLPGHFPVTVIMERQASQVSEWVDYVWKAAGITVGSSRDIPSEPRVIENEDGVQLHFHSGYQVKLHIDECASYYHNLMSPSPRCYIVVQQDDNEDIPVPFLVSLSFDEAHAYLEGDDTVYVVDIPAELYRWTEDFVLVHYCPEERKKRKRKDWWQRKSEHSHQ